MKMGGDKVFIQVYYLNKLHEKLKKVMLLKVHVNGPFNY